MPQYQTLYIKKTLLYIVKRICNLESRKGKSNQIPNQQQLHQFILYNLEFATAFKLKKGEKDEHYRSDQIPQPN